MLLSLAALLGSTALVALPGVARADCVNTGGISYHCTGALTTDVTISGFSLNVTVAPGFGIDTSSPTALFISSSDGVVTFSGGNADLHGAVLGLLVSTHTNGSPVGPLTVTTGGTITGGGVGISILNQSRAPVSLTATGHVEGTSGQGVSVAHTGPNSATIGVASVTGGTHGLLFTSSEQVQTLITATGHVEATAGTGVEVTLHDSFPDPTPRSVTINVATVTGSQNGILFNNVGDSATQITATGHVEGTEERGIDIDFGPGFGATIAVDVTSVTGGTDGIRAYLNMVAGRLTATGHVEGRDGDGIRIDSGSGLLIVNLASVSGGNRGLSVQRFSGTTEITATGHVEGAAAEGIVVLHYNGAQDISIMATSVTGATDGIRTYTSLGGGIGISTTGEVIGKAGEGIWVTTSDTANRETTVTITATDVTGAKNGILVDETGTGETRVTASGHVEGQHETGINITARRGVVIDVASVAGATDGISVNKSGAGDVSVTATGPVTGGTGSGIYAETDSGSLRIEAGDVSGDDYGIWFRKTGAGPTTIATDGLVQGGHAAIFANGNAAFELKNLEGGTWQDMSGRASDLAIVILGGVNTEATIINDGTIIGGLTMSGSILGASLRFENKGLWTYTGSSSMFGATAGNEVINTAGATVIGAVNAAQREDTVLNHLPLFTNQGRVSLVDGAAGDRFTLLHGGAVFGPGSVLAVDIGGNDLSDLFQATGTVQLTGAALEVNLAGPLLLNTPYTVLHASGGLSGTFASITGAPTGAFLQIEDHYDAGYAWVELIRSRDFADAGRSPNQIATAGALDSLAPGSPLVDAMLAMPDDATARQALDLLSGEIHLSSQTALIEDSGFLRNAVNDRIRSAFEGSAPAGPALSFVSGGGSDYRLPADQGPAFWGTAFGSRGSTEGNGNAADLDRDSSGLLIGADQQIGEWRLGLVTGYSSSGFDAADRNSSGNAKSYHLGLYGGTETGRIAIRTALAYSWHDVGNSRSAVVGGLTDSLSADFNANTLQAYGELAWLMGRPDARVEPFINLAHVSLRSEGFTETGGPAALTVAAKSSEVTFTTLGLRVERDFSLGGNPATFKGMAGWRHAFGDTVPTGVHAFAGSDAFSISGAPIAENSAVIEAGLSVDFAPQASFDISYSGQIANGARDHGLKANLLVKF